MPPRQHHILPSFYLAGFTESGTEDGELDVIAIERKKCWPSTPLKSARERDFYALEHADMTQAMEAEHLLGQLEDRIAPVSRKIRDDGVPDSPEEFEALMTFVALMTARTRRVRNVVNAATIAKINGTVRDHISTDEGLTEFCERARIFDRGAQERFRGVVNSARDWFSVGNSWFVGQLGHMAIRLLPVLASRNWKVMTADIDDAVLICSDFPVTILPGEPTEMSPPPGVWRPRMILLPLDRRHVLVSPIRGEVRKATLTPYDIARVNTRTMSHATEVYCGCQDFLWLDGTGQVANRDRLLALLNIVPPRVRTR